MSPVLFFFFFIPVFVFLFISFVVFICHKEFNLYSVKCCLFWLLGFTAFLERPSHLAGPSPDSGTCSLGCKVPCAVLPLCRPSTLALPSTVPSSGWLGRGVGRSPLRQAHPDFRWGEGTACLQQLVGFSFWSSISPLFACAPLSLQISALCLLSAPPQVLC